MVSVVVLLLGLILTSNPHKDRPAPFKLVPGRCPPHICRCHAHATRGRSTTMHFRIQCTGLATSADPMQCTGAAASASASASADSMHLSTPLCVRWRYVVAITGPARGWLNPSHLQSFLCAYLVILVLKNPAAENNLGIYRYQNVKSYHDLNVSVVGFFSNKWSSHIYLDRFLRLQSCLNSFFPLIHLINKKIVFDQGAYQKYLTTLVRCYGNVVYSHMVLLEKPKWSEAEQHIHFALS